MKKLALLLALLMAVSVVPAFAAEEVKTAPVAEKPAEQVEAPKAEEVAVVEGTEKAEEAVAEETEAVEAVEAVAVEDAAVVVAPLAPKVINYKTAMKVYARGTYTWGNVAKVAVDAPENVSIATRGTVVAGYDVDITDSCTMTTEKYAVIAVPYTKETKGTAIYADYTNGRVIRIPVSYVEMDAEAGSGIAYVRYPLYLATKDDHGCDIARMIFVETAKPVYDITFNFLQYIAE